MIRRVALVTEIPSPYRIPVFNTLDELLDGGLEVFFIAETEARRQWTVPEDEIRFRYQILGGAQISIPYRGDRQPIYLAPPLLPRLMRGNFDGVIVGGWNHLECYWSLAYARARRRRFVLWSETPALGPIAQRPLRSLLKRFVIDQADAFVVPGPSAGRYLELHGASPSDIHVAPNAVDVSFWGKRPSDLVDAPHPIVLYVGRLVPPKGLDGALRAFGESRLRDSATFLVAGDGPERAALEAAAPPGVQFLGNQDLAGLRRLYHSADMLVFPSLYDPWGLVVNEAAAASLAAVASDGAGATRDLLRDGENALVTQAGDLASLKQAFDRIAADRALPARLGAAAASISVTNSPEACARGLLESLG
jgi:glycosyltransferase involved in cell wall biosynthesis